MPSESPVSGLSDTPQSESACPLPNRVEFAQWLLRFVDPDRSSGYCDAFWDLLRALLTQYQADGKDGNEPSSLSTQALWRWVLDERGKSVEGLTSDKARKRVNEHWPELEKSFDELQGRFTDAARKAGFTGLLWPTKDKSEGGRSSTYRLEWRPFGATAALPVLPTAYDKLPFVLRYREDRSSLRFSLLGRLFLWQLLFRRQGEASMRIDGVRRYVPAVGVGLTVLLTGLPVLIALMHVADGAFEWKLMIVAAIFFWFLLRPLTRLYGRFIIMASPLFYSFSEKECQVELVWDPEAAVLPGRSRGYNLRLVRYVADCPLCGGNVSLRDDGLGQFNRLVGYCDEEPGEHVFSFDRKLRAGYWRQGR